MKDEFLSNVNTSFLNKIKSNLKKCKSFSFSVSFIKKAGLVLLEREIDNEVEKLLPCYYKGIRLEKFFKTDLVVDDVIVELKSVKELLPAHRAQLFNYLRLTKMPIGLLINFGQPTLQGERYAYIEETNECILLDKDMNLLRPEYADWEDEKENY